MNKEITIRDLRKREFTHQLGRSELTPVDPLHPLSGKGAYLAWSRKETQRLTHSCVDIFCHAGITDWEKVAFIDFRYNMPGIIPIEVFNLPQHCAEVEPFAPFPPHISAMRLVDAKVTGMLMVGPDEKVALRYRRVDGSLGVVVYLNNDQGIPRHVEVGHVDDIESARDQRRIADLTQVEAAQAAARVKEQLLYGQANPNALTALQLERLKLEASLLDGHHARTAPQRTVSGAVITRWFIGGGDVGAIASITPPHKGWVRYGTEKDAWYFGVKINPVLLETMTFAEGDVSHVECDTLEQFMAELEDMAKFYGASRSPSVVGLGGGIRTEYFNNLTLLRGDVRTVRLFKDGVPDAAEGAAAVPLFGALKIDHPDVTRLKLWEVQRVLTTAFELDLYNPMAFWAYEASVQRTPEGFVVIVMVDGKTFCGDVPTPVANPERIA